MTHIMVLLLISMLVHQFGEDH